MTWTYGGDPADNDKDWVRFRIGDTDSARRMVEDEEINAMVAEQSTKQAAAYVTVKALLASLAQQVDSKMGKLTLSLSQKYKALKDLLPELEKEAKKAGGRLGVPWMAAHRIGRRDDVTNDSDRLRPAFGVGMHDDGRQFSEPNSTSLTVR